MEYLLVPHGRISPTPGAVRNAKSSKQKKVFSNHLMNNVHFFLQRESSWKPVLMRSEIVDFSSFVLSQEYVTGYFQIHMKTKQNHSGKNCLNSTDNFYIFGLC
jgi:hypothetical protein